MALPDVNFVRGNQSSGQPLPGQDYISGLVIYTGSIPTAWPASGAKECFSIADAEAAGILNNYNDETAATGTIQITHIGAIGDTITISVVEPLKTVVVAVYTLTAADTTDVLTATHITAAINSNALNNGGYSATNIVSSSPTDTITLTARPGLGKWLNTGTNLITTIVSSTLTDALVQFSGGAASKQAVWHYHISEYFRENPQGLLWVGLFAVPSSFNGAEVATLQNLAGGALRRCLVYVDQHTYTTADIISLNAVASGLDAQHMPLSILYAGDFHSVTDLSTLPDLTLLNSPYVFPVLGQDGGNVGAVLYAAYGKSITNAGAVMGARSAGRIDMSVANPSTTFDLSGVVNGSVENDIAAFANGQLYRTILASTPNLLTQLDNYHWNFSRKFVGATGTWSSGEWTCAPITSNYCHLSDNEVIAKIERLLYVPFLPAVLQASIQLNPDGTIFYPLVKSLEGVGDNALAVMLTNNELSAVATSINPSQNLATGTTFTIVVNYVQNFIARSVTVSINKVNSLS